ncbi:polysaccharide biosynthesis/export family protein [candidate division KSB1 bacterium]|nr:polysaccharide biosynthesis/export family protein [candidate division KSB1 bacterium]
MTKQGCLKKQLSFLFIQILFIGVFLPIAVYGQSLLTSFKPGDAIRLQIWQPWRISEGKAEILGLNGDYAVNSQGYTTLPLIGEIKTIGLNQQTLAARLKEKYSPFIKDPYIMVTPLIRVTLQGAVNRPGAYLIPPTSSLWELVEMANGPSGNANLKKMQSERGGRIVNKNLLRSFEKGYSLQEIGVLSGDQILVPARRSFEYRDALSLATFGMSVALFYLRVTQ